MLFLFDKSCNKLISINDVTKSGSGISKHRALIVFVALCTCCVQGSIRQLCHNLSYPATISTLCNTLHMPQHTVHPTTKCPLSKHAARHCADGTSTPGKSPDPGTALAQLRQQHSHCTSIGAPAYTHKITATRKLHSYFGPGLGPGHGPHGGYMHQGHKMSCKYFPPAEVSSFSIMTVQNLSLYRMLSLGTCKPHNVTTNSALRLWNTHFA